MVWKRRSVGNKLQRPRETWLQRPREAWLLYDAAAAKLYDAGFSSLWCRIKRLLVLWCRKVDDAVKL